MDSAIAVTKKYVKLAESRLTASTIQLKKSISETAHLCAELRLLTYSASMSVASNLDCVDGRKNPKNSRLNNLVREVVHERKRKPLSNLDEILQNSSYFPFNQQCKVW